MFQLFYTFLKIGLFTFGGGWAMIPVIEKEVVDKNHWLTREEFIDSLVVAQGLPGIMAVNISVIVGRKINGRKGSLSATLGASLPSFIIILIIAIFFQKMYDNEIVFAVFKGIRPAVVALILSPAIKMAISSKIGWKIAWLPIVIAGVVWKLGFSPIYVFLIIIFSALAFQYYKSTKKIDK